MQAGEPTETADQTRAVASYSHQHERCRRAMMCQPLVSLVAWFVAAFGIRPSRGFGALLSSHPPIANRIAALQQRA